MTRLLQRIIYKHLPIIALYDSRQEGFAGISIGIHVLHQMAHLRVVIKIDSGQYVVFDVEGMEVDEAVQPSWNTHRCRG